MTLFQFEATQEDADSLCELVDNWLRKDIALQHATFAVAVAKMDRQITFHETLERSLMKTRLHQMRAPNVSIGQGIKRTARSAETDQANGGEGRGNGQSGHHYSPSGFCDFDQKRPRAVNLRRKATSLAPPTQRRRTRTMPVRPRMSGEHMAAQPKSASTRWSLMKRTILILRQPGTSRKLASESSVTVRIAAPTMPSTTSERSSTSTATNSAGSFANLAPMRTASPTRSCGRCDAT